MGSMHVYTLAGDALTEKTSFKAHAEAITRCRYSPDGAYLAVASASKAVEVYEHLCDYAKVRNKTFILEFNFHISHKDIAKYNICNKLTRETDTNVQLDYYYYYYFFYYF